MQKLSLLLIALMLWSCKTSKDTVFTAPYEEEMLDTLTVTAPIFVDREEDYALPRYNPAAERSYDLLHTRLDLSFDWEQEHVLGTATLDISPLFYDIDQVALNAQNFLIHEVRDLTASIPLEYDYDGSVLTIDLGRNISRNDKLKLSIKYTARPSLGPSGGSDAITSDRGLFFINPMGTDKEKPRQIWTQGETEHNSKWFPTFDRPNERCTQEIFLTVEQGLETLSNGTLVSSKNNADGTKTDYWKQDQPHAPYLFMVAVGDFARVKDTWNGKPLEYMVDPPYEADAKAIFNHTPEMLTFFSDILGYPYPWDKYSQVVVEDFVSGAMENTTAVTFGDFVQKTTRELIDDNNDKIVAHEMFHHWFGDLVTCESWANLTLNEGFANYSEYLWLEHKYGKDEADSHRAEELNTYLFMVNQAGTHPLIHYGYEEQEEMFDVHSYNKGGLVLHMLRNLIGKEAFFAALNKYLEDNKYTAVEVDELRMAFEDVTGKDLNWFFDQWYLDEGHPIITVEDKYDAAAQTVTLIVEQTQESTYHRPVFILPFEVAVIDESGKVNFHNATVAARKDTIVLSNIGSKPAAVLLDGKAYTLAEITHKYEEEELVAIVKHSKEWTHKVQAAQLLAGTASMPSLAQLLMKEDHYVLRIMGLEAATEVDDYRVARDLSMMDSHSEVRAAALMKYTEKYPAQGVKVANIILNKNTDAYPTIKAALNVLYEQDKPSAIAYAEKLSAEDTPSLVPAIAELLAETGDKKYLTYIEKNLTKVNVYQVFNVYGAYSALLVQQDVETMYNAAQNLKATAIDDGNMYRRFMATSTINDVEEKLFEINGETPTKELTSKLVDLKSLLNEIKQKEESADLKSRYRAF